MVTTEYVFLELGALMAIGPLRSLFVDLVEGLRSDSGTQVIPASRELFDAGLALFARRPDKEWSLTDCISFVVMERRGIVNALATDHHFEQAGFHSLVLESWRR